MREQTRKTSGGVDVRAQLFRTIAKFFKVNVHSAFVWVKTFEKNNYSKPAPIDDSVVIELDEMWYFVAQKRRVWIGKDYCRTTKQLNNWEYGARDSKTFRKMYERLKKWNVKYSLAIDTAFVVILCHANV